MIYTLEKDQLKISINSFGAQLESLRHLESSAEYMWQREDYGWNQCAPILFPFVGRLKEDTTLIDGHACHMPIHGFIQYMDSSQVTQTAESLSFTFRASPETLSCYPFQFELTIRFEIQDSSLTQYFHVTNTDTRMIYFTLGAHPAFNCPIHPQESFEDYVIFIDCDDKVPLLNPSGTLEPDQLRLIPYLNKKILLRHELFKDDALIFRNIKNKKVRLCHGITEKGIEMNFSHMKHLGIWSPKYINAPFVCLEPWMGLPNILGESMNFTEKTDIISLIPGETFTTDFSLSLFV